MNLTGVIESIISRMTESRASPALRSFAENNVALYPEIKVTQRQRNITDSPQRAGAAPKNVDEDNDAREKANNAARHL